MTTSQVSYYRPRLNGRGIDRIEKRSEPTVIIPIASGFDEVSVVDCVSHLRRRGVRVQLVSVGGHNVRSRHGLTLHADKRVHELKQPHASSRILLTGGDVSLRAVLHSVEMLMLIADTGQLGGELVATTDSQATIEESGILTTLGHLSWRIQADESLSDFLRQIGTF